MAKRRMPTIKLAASPAARRATRRWILAGAAGIACAAALSAFDHFDPLPAQFAGLGPMICGGLAMLMLAPWRIMRGLNTDNRQTIRQLANRLQSITEGNRSSPLSDLLLQRDDELGELSHAIHGLATEVLTNRQRTRLMHRRMDHRVMRETKRATAHLERQAFTDPLTGLGNRRALEQRVDELLGARACTGRIVTVMAIDLDLFKEVNDSLGHEVGDQCLIFLADLLKSSLRREDSAIRLGGDEFIVLMPDRTIEQGRAAAERLASLFAQMPWPYRHPAKPTLSFGLASELAGVLPEGADLLRRADDALYNSKHAGRSIVSEYGEHRGAA